MADTTQGRGRPARPLGDYLKTPWAAIAPRSFSMAFGAATITALLTAFTVYWFAPITGYVPVT